MKIWDKNLGQKFGTNGWTDGRTDRQTDKTVYRVALQLKIAQKDVSYDFETLHVVLSYQKNMIGTLKSDTPPFTPHYDIICGEHNISS